MTKKHFEALATSLASVRPDNDKPATHYVVWIQSVVAVADVCERSNVAFDRVRFVHACQDR